jgi:hypothetical protein
MHLMLCGKCDQHPCECPQTFGLTRDELEELSTLADNTGLRGELLRQKWRDRWVVGVNEAGEPLDGSHAWCALQPTPNSKVRTEIKDIIPDAYEGEQVDLYLGAYEVYEKSGKEFDWKDLMNLMPTSKNKERIKHLMMLYQIIPFSKRPKGSIPPVIILKRKQLSF